MCPPVALEAAMNDDVINPSELSNELEKSEAGTTVPEAEVAPSTDNVEVLEEVAEAVEAVGLEAAGAVEPEAVEAAMPETTLEAAKIEAAKGETVDEEDEDDNIGNRIDYEGPKGGGGRRGPSLSEQDPYWQFGTPVESWGSTQGRQGGVVAGTGLKEDDPYWTFGAPPSYWGKSKDGSSSAQGHGRPRVYFECVRCGVKVERKAMHRGGAFCPFCNRPMRQVGGAPTGRPGDRRDSRHRPGPGPDSATPEAAPAPVVPAEPTEPTVPTVLPASTEPEAGGEQ